MIPTFPQISGEIQPFFHSLPRGKAVGKNI
jgi:hypothetical protein